MSTHKPVPTEPENWKCSGCADWTWVGDPGYGSRDLYRSFQEHRDTVYSSVHNHVFTEHSSGDGYSEPREAWIDCSCGETVWAYQQFYAEATEDQEAAKQRHLDTYTLRVRVQAVLDVDIMPPSTRIDLIRKILGETA